MPQALDPPVCETLILRYRNSIVL